MAKKLPVKQFHLTVLIYDGQGNEAAVAMRVVEATGLLARRRAIHHWMKRGIAVRHIEIGASK